MALNFKSLKLLSTIFCVLFVTSANAEIHKEHRICDDSGKLCFYWWPKLPEIEGWEQDISNSYQYSSNTQAPLGLNFSNAETVIYAKAVYKLRVPEFKNLGQFIDGDKASFNKKEQRLLISEQGKLITGSGIELFHYSFYPINNGNWEHVCYGEEKDSDGNEYYITFVISSRSEEGLKLNFAKYEEFIKNYR